MSVSRASAALRYCGLDQPLSVNVNKRLTPPSTFDALAKVHRIELGPPGSLDRPASTAAALDRLEQRAGQDETCAQAGIDTIKDAAQIQRHRPIRSPSRGGVSSDTWLSDAAYMTTPTTIIGQARIAALSIRRAY
jgi:hypothetical protein